MPYKQEMFIPDVLGSIVVPAFPSNIIGFSDGSYPRNHPRVNMYHTPEEDADDIEVTPYYFARDLRPRRASTHYYSDSDGDRYQMVPEKYGAIANGVTIGMPYPMDTDPSISLNLQSRSDEIEGRAHNIHLTCVRGEPQWRDVVRFCIEGFQLHGIPMDVEHNLHHKQVSNQRSDAGQLNLAHVCEDAVKLVNKAFDMRLIGGIDMAPDPQFWRDAGNPRGTVYLVVGAGFARRAMKGERGFLAKEFKISSAVKLVPKRTLDKIPEVPNP